MKMVSGRLSRPETFFVDGLVPCCRLYLPLYAAFAIARAYWFPHSGPTANAYPYDYLIITQFTWGGAGVACLKIVAIYLAVGVVLCLFGRALPAKSAAE